MVQHRDENPNAGSMDATVANSAHLAIFFGIRERGMVQPTSLSARIVALSSPGQLQGTDTWLAVSAKAEQMEAGSQEVMERTIGVYLEVDGYSAAISEYTTQCRIYPYIDQK